MADTIGQNIIDAVNTRFITILTDNGYQTNLGSNIFWNKAIDENNPLQATEIPAAVIKDSEAMPEPLSFKTFLRRLNLNITMVAADAATIRKIVADIEDCIDVDDQWSTLAEDTIRDAVEMNIEHYDEKYARAEMDITIEYVTTRFDHYS